MNKRECAACLSVVIPAYNEEATLADVVHKVIESVPALLEVVIVDDCSTDATRQIANELATSHTEVRVARHAERRGKSAALRTGFALTRGDIVIVQDADLEYNPSEIWEVIEPIVAGRADVVFGSRFLVRKAARVLYFRHYI